MKIPKKSHPSERPSPEWWADAMKRANQVLNGSPSMEMETEPDFDTNQLQVTFVPMQKATQPTKKSK